MDWRIRIAHLLVQKADFHLETGSQGRNNWSVESAGSVGSNGIDFHIDTLEVLDSTLSFQPVQGTPRSVAIARLDLQGLGSPELALDAAVRVQGLPFSVSAASGAQGDVKTRRWSFRVRAETDDATIDAKGSSNAPFDLSVLDANLDLRGRNLKSLQRLVALEYLPTGPFQTTFRLTRNETGYRLRDIVGSFDDDLPGRIVVTKGEASVSVDNTLTASLEGSLGRTGATLKMQLAGPGGQNGSDPRQLELVGTLGDTALRGSLRLAPGGARLKITGDLSFTKIDLTGIAQDEDASKQPVPQPGAGKAWSERPLPVAVLQSFDADVTLKADLVVGERLQAKDIQGQALLDNGRLRLEAFSATLPGYL